MYNIMLKLCAKRVLVSGSDSRCFLNKTKFEEKNLMALNDPLPLLLEKVMKKFHSFSLTEVCGFDVDFMRC